MKEPEGIVLHHCMNDGYSAIAERNFLDNLKLGKNAIYYGTHYIIGQNGEVINCIPEDEIAYHRGSSENSDGYISIEYCSESGGRPLSYNAKLALKRLVIDIAARHGFNTDRSFFRHSDVADKKCPAYYSHNNEKWGILKKEIADEKEAAAALRKNSAATAEKLSNIIGADKRYIKLVLEQKTNPDTILMAKIFEKLLEM